MNSIMISIQPKWCELIMNGEKTIEVRKTKPNIETPFKCFIYATKSKRNVIGNVVSYSFRSGIEFDVGKVIGEFVCDKIEKIFVMPNAIYSTRGIYGDKAKEMCLSDHDLASYLGYDCEGRPNFGYAWHIAELKIYDTPKELKAFRKEGFMTEEDWHFALYPNTHCSYVAWAKKFEISRPPQSWCSCEIKQPQGR